MTLDKFLDDFLGNVMTREGIKKVKEHIKEDMKSSDLNYDTAKVECQIFDDENNYEPDVQISSEGYSDGEVIFIDYIFKGQDKE